MKLFLSSMVFLFGATSRSLEQCLIILNIFVVQSINLLMKKHSMDRVSTLLLPDHSLTSGEFRKGSRWIGPIWISYSTATCSTGYWVWYTTCCCWHLPKNKHAFFTSHREINRRGQLVTLQRYSPIKVTLILIKGLKYHIIIWFALTTLVAVLRL